MTAKERKERPVYSGVLRYFPDALDIAEAELLAYPLPAAPPVPDTCRQCGDVTEQGRQYCTACAILPPFPPRSAVTDTPQGMDDSRCAVCGWPLDPEGKMCLRGSCSQRPLPKAAADPVRAVAEYEAAGHRVEFSEALARWCEQADAAPAAPPQEDQ